MLFVTCAAALVALHLALRDGAPYPLLLLLMSLAGASSLGFIGSGLHLC